MPDDFLQRVHEATLAELHERYRLALKANDEAVRSMTHEDARQENDKDTRAIETSFLARGHAVRVEELADAIARIEALFRSFRQKERVHVGSVFQVRVFEDDKEEDQRVFLVLPSIAGLSVHVAGQDVLSITPASPVGRALVGCREGDEVDVAMPLRKRSYAVTKLFSD